MIYALSRPSEVDQLLREIATFDLAAAADVTRQALVAEVIFGDFKCSPRLVAELTPNFFRLVTSETWHPHREAILKLILESGSRGNAREMARSKLDEWFPNPLTYRGYIYLTLKSWPKEIAKDLLWLGLFNEISDNKSAAAATIAEIFLGDKEIGDRLHDLCHSIVEADTLSVTN